METDRIAGSFRDPAGHVFVEQGVVYRQINEAGKDDYDQLTRSGLYDALVAARVLIPHDDLGLPADAGPEVYKIIRPTHLPLVNYPYEWCFSQLKDAALLTLAAQRRALHAGMCLKDASAYNVQFLDGRPILIDTLSFEGLIPGPWKAYRQFCQHFLGPLALMSAVDVRLGRTLQSFIDGLPLRVVSRSLPRRTWLRPGPLIHLHLHAWADEHLGRRGEPGAAANGSRGVKASLLHSLEAATTRLRWRPRSSWVGYYEDRESYSAEAAEHKADLVAEWLDAIEPRTVWDLGANTGRYSRLASERGAATIAFDQDVACVETMYLEVKQRGDHNLLPLVMDFTNPSPSLGWASEERASLVQRGPAEVALVLALEHHLAFANNVPLDRLARFLRGIGRHVLVEFVPSSDPMALRLIRDRRDLFTGYHQDAFEAAFRGVFTLERCARLRGSERVLYWMRA